MTKAVLAIASLVLLGRPGLPQENRELDVIKEMRRITARLNQALDRNDLRSVREEVDNLNAAMRNTDSPEQSSRTLLAELEASLAKTPLSRDAAVWRIAVRAELAQEYQKARVFALEALEYSRRVGRFRPQNGYYASQVLGLLALREGDPGSAGRFLVSSLDLGGWPQLSNVGPNLRLAQELAKAGHVEPVIQYLERCKSVWPQGESKLVGWLAILRDRKTPDFAPYHLIYP